MALSSATTVIGKFNNQNAKIQRIAHSATASETSATMKPGPGLIIAVGGYVDYTISGNTYTMAIIDGGAASYSNVLFLGP